MNIFQSLIVAFLAIIMISCEANKLISVTVVDKSTKQPIDSVYVKINAGKNGDYTKNQAAGYTDTAGKFETYMMIGCAFGCYDIYITYTKNGYNIKEDLNKTEGTVELEEL
jgi:hypothetical protein